MAAPAPSPLEEADVSAAHELRADALLLGCVVVGLVRVLHVVNLTINLFKEIKAVQEDAGGRGMGEHVHDRDQTGRRPPVAKAVLLDQMLHDLSRDKRAPSPLRRRQLSLKLRSTLVIAATEKSGARGRDRSDVRCASEHSAGHVPMRVRARMRMLCDGATGAWAGGAALTMACP